MILVSVVLLRILIVMNDISECGAASNSDCNVVGIKLMSYRYCFEFGLS